MSTENYILITRLCSVYQVERSFFEELHEIGLIEIEFLDNDYYFPENRIGDLEKILRIQEEFRINMEGIDVVFNLLQRIENLQEEVRSLKQQLSVFQNRNTQEEEF